MIVFEQPPMTAAGVGDRVASTVSEDSIGPSSPGITEGCANGLAGKVTVGATSRVGAVGACGDPMGVGDDKGVANIFGVGGGGLSKSSGRVGAIRMFTKATNEPINRNMAMKPNALRCKR